MMSNGLQGLMSRQIPGQWSGGMSGGRAGQWTGGMSPATYW